MKFQGKITNARETNEGWVVTLATHSLMGLEALLNKQLDVELKQHRQSRSLDANRYLHKLLNMMADELTSIGSATSMERVKQMMVCDYGQPLLDKDDYQVMVAIRLDEPYAMIGENYAKRVGAHTEMRNGEMIMLYEYALFRGTHTYNTKEFSNLLEGVIAECRDLGIDTTTPGDYEKMMQAWRETHG